MVVAAVIAEVAAGGSSGGVNVMASCSYGPCCNSCCHCLVAVVAIVVVVDGGCHSVPIVVLVS